VQVLLAAQLNSAKPLVRSYQSVCRIDRKKIVFDENTLFTLVSDGLLEGDMENRCFTEIRLNKGGAPKEAERLPSSMTVHSHREFQQRIIPWKQYISDAEWFCTRLTAAKLGGYLEMRGCTNEQRRWKALLARGKVTILSLKSKALPPWIQVLMDKSNLKLEENDAETLAVAVEQGFTASFDRVKRVWFELRNRTDVAIISGMEHQLRAGYLKVHSGDEISKTPIPHYQCSKGTSCSSMCICGKSKLVYHRFHKVDLRAFLKARQPLICPACKAAAADREKETMLHQHTIRAKKWAKIREKRDAEKLNEISERIRAEFGEEMPEGTAVEEAQSQLWRLQNERANPAAGAAVQHSSSNESFDIDFELFD
jgi:hypothetical protein